MSSVLRDPIAEVSGDAPPRALIQAWRDEPLDPIRVQRAYLRFRKRSWAAAARRPAAFARWVALGIAIGMGSVYAAAAASSALSRTGEALGFAPSTPPALQNRAPRRSSEPSPRTQTTEPPSPTPVQTAIGAAPPPLPSPVIASAPASASPEQWRRAARGMRQGDFEGASAALSELSRHGSAADRESALLVQAQLLLSRGKTAEAKAILQTLADAASAPSVRRKSAELLSRKAELPSRRSFEPPAGTNLQ